MKTTFKILYYLATISSGVVVAIGFVDKNIYFFALGVAMFVGNAINYFLWNKEV